MNQSTTDTTRHSSPDRLINTSTLTLQNQIQPNPANRLSTKNVRPPFNLHKNLSHFLKYLYVTIIIIFNLRTAAWIRRSNFRHQASLRVSPRESTQRRKMELWARNVSRILPNMPNYTLHYGYFHAVKLRHGTDGFTSSPKEGVLRGFLFYS
jgi:hypothetical protein